MLQQHTSITTIEDSLTLYAIVNANGQEEIAAKVVYHMF